MEKGKRTTYKQLSIYKRLHRKLKIEQREPPQTKPKTKQKKVGVNADVRKAI
jgi:hypothetical protein